MKTEIENLRASIEEKQLILQQSRPNATTDQISTMEGEIDALQKQYLAIGDSTKYIDQSPKLPDLDAQMEFIDSVCQGFPVNGAPGIFEAIYQTLEFAKQVRENSLRIEPKEDKILSSAERSISLITSPVYDRKAQHKFVELLLIDAEISNEPEHILLRQMYAGINHTIEVADWVVASCAQSLLEIPGNQPEVISDERDLKIILSPKCDGTEWLARFSDFKDEKDPAGFGKTEQEAISNLFAAKEKKKQTELFPEGGLHE